MGLSTVELFQVSRWREKGALSDYSEDQGSKLGKEGSKATKGTMNYISGDGQWLRELGGVFQHTPVSDVILEELKILQITHSYHKYLLKTYYNF